MKSEISRSFYQKACKEREKITKSLIGLTEEREDRAIGFESVGDILMHKRYDFLRGGAKK